AVALVPAAVAVVAAPGGVRGLRFGGLRLGGRGGLSTRRALGCRRGLGAGGALRRRRGLVLDALAGGGDAQLLDPLLQVGLQRLVHLAGQLLDVQLGAVDGRAGPATAAGVRRAGGRVDVL